MSDTEKLLIDKLIEDKLYLKSDLIYKKGYDYVKQILNMKMMS